MTSLASPYDSESDDQPTIGQETLSPEALAALLAFYTPDPDPPTSSDPTLPSTNNLSSEEPPEASKRLKATDVCVAYTPGDVASITATFHRLQSATLKSLERNQQILDQRTVHKLEYVVKPSNVKFMKRQRYADVIVTEIADNGICLIPNILPPSICARLLSFVNNKLEQDNVKTTDASEASGYGNVLSRENRWDLYLNGKDEGVVREALVYMLSDARVEEVKEEQGEEEVCIEGILRDVFDRMFSSSSDTQTAETAAHATTPPNAQFHELSALVSDPGSNAQPIHPDTPYSPKPQLFTIFLSLQQTTSSMGPTLFLPTTHSESTLHVDFKDTKNGGKEKVLGNARYEEALMECGDGCVMDSRCLHSGGSNVSHLENGNEGKRRVLLYFTLRDPRFSENAGDYVDNGSLIEGMGLSLHGF